MVNPRKDFDVEEYEYKPPNKYVQGNEDRKFSKSNNNSNNSQNRSSSSNLRSTVPINPYYAEVVELVKSRNSKVIQELIEEEPHKFYDPIDNMGKTILHYAWEK